MIRPSVLKLCLLGMLLSLVGGEAIASRPDVGKTQEPFNLLNEIDLGALSVVTSYLSTTDLLSLLEAQMHATARVAREGSEGMCFNYFSMLRQTQAALKPNQLVTWTGHIFYKINDPEIIKKLGSDARVTPDGMILGSAIKADDPRCNPQLGDVQGNGLCKMSHARATAACVSIGARLPEKEEWKILASWMGAPEKYEDFSVPAAYVKQEKIVPNLNHWFWSSTSDGTGHAFYFSGRVGYVGKSGQDARLPVRCAINAE